MSETPEQKLAVLIGTLTAATPLVTHLHEDDPLRRKLYDTLLTAQLRDPERRRALQHWMTQPATPPGVPLGDPERALASMVDPGNIERLRLVPKIGTLAPAQPDDATAQCFTCSSKFAHPAESARVAWLRSHERLHDVTTVPADLRDAGFAAAVDDARAQALAAADREGLQPCGCVIVRGSAAAVCERHRSPSPLQCVHAWHAIVRDGNTPPDDACPGLCGATVQTSTIATDVDWCSCTGDSPTRRHPRGEPGCQHAAAPTDPIDGEGIPHKGHYEVTDTPRTHDETLVAAGMPPVLVDHMRRTTERLSSELGERVTFNTDDVEPMPHPGKDVAVDITAPVPAGIGCTECGAQLGTNKRCETCLSMAPPMPAVQFGKATLT
jgi:hypothetical protein